MNTGQNPRPMRPCVIAATGDHGAVRRMEIAR
jgi:hypothetical protein